MFYEHFIPSRLSASPLNAKEESSLLAYFNAPPLAEFQAQMADGLSQVLAQCTLAFGPEQSGTISFTATPTGAPTNASNQLDGYLGLGYAILLRKDAPKTAGSGAALQGILTSDPQKLQTIAAKDGAYAILKPFTPAGSMSTPAPGPIEKINFAKTDYSGLLTIAVIAVAGLAVIGVLPIPRLKRAANPVLTRDERVALLKVRAAMRFRFGKHMVHQPPKPTPAEALEEQRAVLAKVPPSIFGRLEKRGLIVDRPLYRLTEAGYAALVR